MATESQTEPVIAPEKQAGNQVTTRALIKGSAYRSIVTAIVIGLATLSSLWLILLTQDTEPADELIQLKTSVPAQEFDKPWDRALDRVEERYRRINQRLASLSGWIDQKFQGQQTDRVEVGRQLAMIAESIQAMNATVAELTASNTGIRQELATAIWRLDSLIDETRKRSKARQKSRPKPAPANKLPFQIDAIDIWDDAIYVAVSHDGRAAFLKLGDQRAG